MTSQVKVMIYFCLYGDLLGDLQLVLHNPKLIQKHSGKDQMNPQILFGMAKALYTIGQELSVGALKTLNLKNYFLVSKSCTNTLLVFVMENSKKSTELLPQIEGEMEKMLALFGNSLPRLNVLSFDPNPIALDDFKTKFKEILPSLKKAIKYLKLKKIF